MGSETFFSTLAVVLGATGFLAGTAGFTATGFFAAAGLAALAGSAAFGFEAFVEGAFAEDFATGFAAGLAEAFFAGRAFFAAGFLLGAAAVGDFFGLLAGMGKWTEFG